MRTALGRVIGRVIVVVELIVIVGIQSPRESYIAGQHIVSVAPHEARDRATETPAGRNDRVRPQWPETR